MSIRGSLTKQFAQALLDDGNNVTDIARLMGVSRPTVYAWLRGEPATRHFKRLAELAGHKLPDNRDLIDALTGKRANWDD